MVTGPKVPDSVEAGADFAEARTESPTKDNREERNRMVETSACELRKDLTLYPVRTSIENCRRQGGKSRPKKLETCLPSITRPVYMGHAGDLYSAVKVVSR